ncbi:MAG: 3-isopropylmalate dehydrogenase [Clostridia bacterium]|nr:3-isopropylmalate dehydrogenase [Clostridia bacterium]MDR3644244.1 3-isopropylmalate dehydrogenase [Clostridia bacterium]
MEYNIALIRGDGIGPEIVGEAVRVLEKTGEVFSHRFHFTDLLMGGCAIDRIGTPLPDETVEICLKSDAVLLGAVGGPKWDSLPGHLRPEKGLLGIRAALGLYANLRPARLYPALKDACPLKDGVCASGIDLVVVRELTGGIYFGVRGRRQGKNGQEAFDTECYSEKEIARIGKIAFDLARSRRAKVTSIDKANVLESSRLWREVMHGIAGQNAGIDYTDMLVDNAAMQLVRDPSQFDVIVTSNLFGDILSDEASMVTGSIGMLPSASLGEGRPGLYEPIHGSAPDIAGRGMANPVATILSAAMLLRSSLGLEKEARAVEAAVEETLAAGLRTADLAGPGCAPVSTGEMGVEIARRIR